MLIEKKKPSCAANPHTSAAVNQNPGKSLVFRATGR
jgi:hypothetical protein